MEGGIIVTFFFFVFFFLFFLKIYFSVFPVALHRVNTFFWGAGQSAHLRPLAWARRENGAPLLESHHLCHCFPFYQSWKTGPHGRGLDCGALLPQALPLPPPSYSRAAPQGRLSDVPPSMAAAVFPLLLCVVLSMHNSVVISHHQGPPIWCLMKSEICVQDTIPIPDTMRTPYCVL